ncbi:MAG TPA: nuclear transport factor 2 family protein [Flavisolibacter sp.]|nr:nuclear transport factor 2 family protein [Flavisolibacter sp.]
MVNAQNTQDIKQTLHDFNSAVTNKDIDQAFSVFDNDANVLLAGSGIEELHKGNAAIRNFLKTFFSNPFYVSWDMSNMTIDQNLDTAWVFVNGAVTINHDNGSTSNMPYRITVVMIIKDAAWKWRLFNGSVPQQE